MPGLPWRRLPGHRPARSLHGVNRTGSFALRIAMRVANEAHLLLLCIVGDIVISGLAYSIIEHHGPIAGMWWAIVTGSTVGYGDQYPKTTAGRFIGMCCIISSILFIAIATAQLSAKLIVNSDAWTDDEQEDLKTKVHEIHAWILEQREAAEHVARN